VVYILQDLPSPGGFFMFHKFTDICQGVQTSGRVQWIFTLSTESVYLAQNSCAAILLKGSVTIFFIHCTF
jgi:hypothetical protein